MSEWDAKSLAILWLGIFCTTSTIVWAVAAAHIYMTPQTAAQICAYNSEARSSAFCVKLAEMRHDK